MKRYGWMVLIGLLILGKPFFAFAQERPKVALVLSGGGARAAAHLGVVKVLEQAGVPIDLIVGASYGALVGGLYAAGYSADDLIRIMRALDWQEITDDRPDRELLNYTHKQGSDRNLIAVHLEDFSPRLPQGIFAGQKIQQVLDLLTTPATYLCENDFDQLPIPFRTVATDVLTGQTYIYKSGDLSTAIRASIAIPGFFTPIVTEETMLVDGGIANNLPVDVAIAAGADFVIAVDSSTPLRTQIDQIEDFIDIFDQAISYRIEEKKMENRKLADVFIMPDLYGYGNSDFDLLDQVIVLGEEAGEQHLGAILTELQDLNIGLLADKKRASLLPKTFDIKRWSGVPLDVVVDAIRFEGTDVDYADLLQDQLQTPLGKPVSLHIVDQDVSRLYATGLFETVSYTLNRDEDYTVLVFTVREVGQTELGFGVHYDQDFQLLALAEYWQRHLIGRGSDLFLRGVLGKLKLGEASIYSPPLTKVLVRFMAQLHWHSQDRLAFQEGMRLSDFEESRYQAKMGLQQLFGNWGSAKFGYQFERLRIRKGVPLFEDVSDYVPNLWVDLGIDTRDKAFLPERGIFWRFRGKRVFGTPDYYHVMGSGAQYFPLHEDWTLGLEGSGGYVSQTAPLYDYIYVGGAGHFDVAAIDFPGLHRDALRVMRMVSGSVVLRKRFREPSIEILRDMSVGVFYQAGVFSRDPMLTALDEWIHGFGVGVYLDRRFPGPMRLELTESSRRMFSIYASVGYGF